MVPVKRFALEQHEGPYEKWPLRSRLFVDGRLSGVSLPGYVLLHQFDTPCGYILVTDCDCPFEEFTYFTLLSHDLRLLSCRCLGLPYVSFLLDKIDWIDERTFIAVFDEHCQYHFAIRRWGIPYFRPWLKMRQLWRLRAGRRDIG